MTALPLRRSFTDAHGVEITFFEWPVANPRGVVQILHGLGEHARRYDHVAEALNRAGYSVYADDHRGHGETGFEMQSKGQIKRQGNLGPGGMKATFDAVHALSLKIRSECSDKPLILLGHSWGSMIAQRLYNRHASDYQGLVLSGSTLLVPGILPTSGFNKKWASEVGSNGFEWLSRDKSVGEKFAADPKNFPETAIQVFGAVNAARLLGVPRKSIPASTPVLLIAGSDDPLGGERGNKLLADAFLRAGAIDLTLYVYDDARHEVFNELNQQQVIDDLVAWLAERYTG